MVSDTLIPVALDKDLVYRLLNGLYRGAAGKALKVVIDVEGAYHVESKELRMVIEIDPDEKHLKSIKIHNGKQSSAVNKQQMKDMGLASLGQDVVKELRDKYSPVFHSLADNIVVFSRAYGNPALD